MHCKDSSIDDEHQKGLFLEPDLDRVEMSVF
jgi:hypothetical protein